MIIRPILVFGVRHFKLFFLSVQLFSPFLERGAEGDVNGVSWRSIRQERARAQLLVRGDVFVYFSPCYDYSNGYSTFDRFAAFAIAKGPILAANIAIEDITCHVGFSVKQLSWLKPKNQGRFAGIAKVTSTPLPSKI